MIYGLVYAILLLQYPKSGEGIVDFFLGAVVGVGSGVAFNVLLLLLLT